MFDTMTFKLVLLTDETPGENNKYDRIYNQWINQKYLIDTSLPLKNLSYLKTMNSVFKMYLNLSAQFKFKQFNLTFKYTV